MATDRIWVVRAGRGSEIVDEVESKGVVAIGWGELGDCSALETRAEFKQRFPEVYPDAKSIGNAAGQVYRFVREMPVGSTVLTWHTARRELLVGEVTGEYRYDPSVIDERFPHVRSVAWRGSIGRDEMSKEFKNSAGGLSTVFTVGDFGDEIERLLAGIPPEPQDADDEAEEFDFLADTEAKADELISDRLANIPWEQFEQFVAAVLRALGFRTKLTQRGADGGYDVVAHPDALGFEEPRIKVEVKHRKAAMGAPEIRSFRSTIGPSEKGLYISTGGFTTEALREPEKAGPPLVLIHRDQFIELLTEHYEAMEPEFQAMLPMKRVYIPTET